MTDDPPMPMVIKNDTEPLIIDDEKVAKFEYLVNDENASK